MKIGILTLPLHTNYGGILQAWALQTVLERMGHEVKVLSREKKYNLSPFFWLVRVPSRIVRRLLGKKVGILNEVHYNKVQDQIRVNIEPTINQYIHRDKRYLDEIKEYDYECFVVGSDQIWRPRYIKSTLMSTIKNAFLGFAKSWNVKRISYAASFGTDEWEYTPEQTRTVSDLIQKFDAVSVREKSGQDLCATYLNVNAEHILDPTMLLTKEDYVSAFNIDQEPKSEGTLMVYVLDHSDEKSGFINRIAKEKGLVPFTVGAKIDDGKAPIEDRIQPKLQKWLRGFYDAEFIVTDSFHACVFSILFGKPFIAIGNAERGLSRFESLLGLFDLNKNLISDIFQYDSSKDYSIPYSAYQMLGQWRDKSMTYLTSNLS
ncbi:MAG: polysaccharide pyruvyl transferase family protein [Bacteroidales bacterium]|jgi:hypothetical protein|nr:polysaccharide pyruvyl transferase family protein [Bacteroidales bacterium]